ncbi:MAG: Flp pilus assembly complex ATPase component TadA [Halobacteria archaeon]|nr:Flp pilus assembly complex ATPase component TadA [Halobacteria archaeon]
MSVAQENLTGEILRTRVGVMTHLAPRSALNTEEIVQELVDATTDCIQQREIQLIIDLSAVQVVNSLALEALIDIQDKLVRLGGWAKVIHPNSLVQDIFRITGFAEYVNVMDAAHVDIRSKPGKQNRLGDSLVEKDILTQKRVEEAVALQQKTGKRMGQILIENGWASEQDVLMAIGEQLSVPYVRLRAGIYDPDVANLLDRKTAVRLRVVPLQKVRGSVALAATDPQAIPSFDEVEQRIGCRVYPVLAQRKEILSTIDDVYAGNTDDIIMVSDVDEDFEIVENLVPEDYSVIDEMSQGSPIINLVNSMVQRAVRDGASDIHLEPGRGKSRVRYRIDGLLYEVTTLRSDLHPAIVSRMKVMANLDISERRLPQDGRIQVQTQGRAVDLRFSSLPGLYGEKIVLRILDKNQSLLDVNKLGMSQDNVTLFKSLLDNSNGLILVTGPTGSGKTTSLYAALNYLNSIEKNIVTIEDPVEYQIDIINQNEVRENIGLTFSSILRHTLRQDPDIVMVGEIRDRETAEIAVQAALTGHLVLSTLHTNHAIGAITRMIDMGVEPYLLSSALIGVIAQRLVRTVCPACKTEYVAPPDLVTRFGWEDQGQIRLARGRGCQECYDSGHKGRIGIHEILRADEDLQRLVTSNPGRDELARYLEERNIRTLFHDGLDHVRRGDTTIEEISRVINL